MSASEKLKALEPARRGYLSSNFDAGGEEIVRAHSLYLRALPQIVAVVEAAETCARHDGRNDSGLTRLSASDARIALAALEEVLT